MGRIAWLGRTRQPLRLIPVEAVTLILHALQKTLCFARRQSNPLPFVGILLEINVSYLCAFNKRSHPNKTRVSAPSGELLRTL